MTFDKWWGKKSSGSPIASVVEPIAREVWNAAVLACADIAESCEPDDNGRLTVQDIAYAILKGCSKGKSEDG